MASNPVAKEDLTISINKFPDGIVVTCGGRITSATTEKLKAAVKPLFSENNFIVLELKNVSYMDSSGLGTIAGLYVTAKAAKSKLQLMHLNDRVKELFSLTRLGEFLTEGRDPRDIYPS